MSSLSENLPPHNPLQRDQRHPPSSFGLWGYLSRHAGITPPNPPLSSNANAKSMMPSITPFDKAGASTRILLHDTQAHLEKFSERVTQLIAGVADAKRELVAVQKLYQEDHEQLVERMIGLTNRCQAELQKTIGTPAQSSELRDALKAVEGLGSRLETLDKKVDMLGMVGQTQSQALQSLQDQQGQILTALLPVLPLLQAVLLHIASSLNKVVDAISNSKSDVKLWISDLDDRVKQSYEVLGNQIKSSLPQDQVSQGVLALQPRVQDSVSELRQHISTLAEATSPADRLARGTSRSQSGSQKRPRSASSGDTGPSDPATSPSDSRKRRLGNPSPSGRTTTTSPARPSHPVSRSAPRRIHTPTVLTGTPSSSIHSSPDVPLLSAAMRSSDRPVTVRTPLADLDPWTPSTTLNLGTPASAVSPVPKQLCSSRPSATLHIRPSAPSLAGMPTRTSSTQPNNAHAPRPSGPAAPPGSAAATATRTPPPTEAARITSGTGGFKLPLPARALSRTAVATTTPPRRTTLNRGTSSFRHPSLSSKHTCSSGGSVQAQASGSGTRMLAHGLSASRDVAVPNPHVFGAGLPVGASGATPRTPRSPLDMSASTKVAPSPPLLPLLPLLLSLPLPPPPPPPTMPGTGKPMSLRDLRAMLREDRSRDEGKRFISLDDEEDDDVETEG